MGQNEGEAKDDLPLAAGQSQGGVVRTARLVDIDYDDAGGNLSDRRVAREAQGNPQDICLGWRPNVKG